MLRRIFLLIIIAILVCLTFGPAVSGRGFSGAAEAAQADGKPRQVIVVIDKLSLSEIDRKTMPNLVRLQELGSIGLMNTGTMGAKEPANTYMAVANGQRTGGGDWGGYFFSVSEFVYAGQYSLDTGRQRAGELYTAYTGWQPGSAAIVNPGIADMLKINSKLKYDVQVGNLGEHLQASGISRAVIGNADTNVPRRYVAALVMDGRGRVPRGYIDSSVNLKDPFFPNGQRTDYKVMLARTAELLKSNELVVVDLGDLSRVEEARTLSTVKRYEGLRSAALKRIDSFIGKLLPLLDLKRDRVMVLVPTPAFMELKNNNIVTPLLISGGGINQDGLLTSPGTRRQGIISNLDIAPTVLAFYGITNASNLDGRPITGIESGDSLMKLKKLNESLVLLYQHRPPLLTGTAVLEIVTIISSLLVIRFAARWQWYIWFQRLALFFLALPLFMLYYTFIQFSSIYVSIAALIGVVVIIIAIMDYLKLSGVWKMAVISLLTSIAVIIDLFTGAGLIMTSPLGYDAMVGARYYGIGNEFAGILLGSTLLGLGALGQSLKLYDRSKWWKVIFVVYLVVVTVVLYAPGLGAEAGGVIAATVAFIYFMLLINDKTLNLRLTAMLLIAALTVLFSGAAADYYINGTGASHIGKAMGQVLQGGWIEALNIIERKMLMNWWLMKFSVWSKVLLATIAGLAFFTNYPKGIFKTLESKYVYIFKGIKAAIVATIIGFIVNDSGVVQAATTVIYVIFPLIYLVLQEKLNKSH